uniref:proline-rich protein PRCC-like n=1 Tax=Styela clava TaxID=7725 RepID=UPI001939B2F1|nr:proline-rich protein PRCC-like [Styela clava]
MSLVGYDVSSGSESENDDNETPVPAISTPSSADSHTSSTLKLSSILPKPIGKEGPTSLFSSTPVSSKKRSIRISAPEIPVLDSDDSDNESEIGPPKKKLQPSKTRSGLFAKLPPPVNAISTGKHSNTSFVPYVFSKPKKDIPPPKKLTTTSTQNDDNKTGSSTTSSTVPSIAEIRRRSSQAAAKLLSTKVAAKTSSDENDSDDIAPVGFFSYVEKLPESEIPEIDLPEIDTEPELSEAPDYNYNHPAQDNIPYHTQFDEQEPMPEQSDMAAGDSTDEFLRIQGKRNRKEEINFIDIRADDALEGNKELLLKQISEEKNMNRTSHSKKKTNAPGGILKRKHQLSYLVHQAKAREIELKNSWAQNRLTKQQTQSKYGF